MDANTTDVSRNRCMLRGPLASRGYDWWWHSFTAHHAQTGEQKAFFVEFFLINPALAELDPTFGQLPFNQADHKPPSYVMVKAGCWGENARQLHRFFAWSDVEVGMGVPYFVAADDCLACETDLIGRVDVSAEDAAAHPEWMSDAGSMLWDLRLDKQLAFNVGYGASPAVRATQAFDMFWHVEGMKTRYSGTVVLDGETYVVDPATSFGYADKNWGRDFTSPWVWLASSNIRSEESGRALENTAFVVGGGRPKVGPVALDRKLLGALVYEGRTYEFNFSKPWTGSQTRFDCGEQDDQIVWHVELETFDALLVCDITCPQSHMIFANYEAPDGAKRYSRLWNGGTGTGRLKLYDKRDGALVPVDTLLVANVGCEYGEYDV
ncbi:MAG: tocopherol cyclase family protein [Coriobacteriia bacterium]|nr:tocopherol cyclase family protein [Coriobacteriia bacterium]